LSIIQRFLPFFSSDPGVQILWTVARALFNYLFPLVIE